MDWSEVKEALIESPAHPTLLSRRRRPGGGRRLIALAIIGIVAGLLFGVVLSRPTTTNAPPPPAPVARTTAEQLGALQQAVDDRPDDPGAWRALAGVAVARAAQTGDTTYYDIAQQALDRAGALRPDAPETAIGQGTLALARHEFAAALRHGQRALADLPANTGALAVVVDAQIELGRYDAAERRVAQMLQRRPGLTALSRVSYLRELHGDVAGAATAMQAAEAAAAGPADRGPVSALRGDLAMLSGDLDAAADHYLSARADVPDLVAAHLGLARVDAARGDLRGAIGDLEDLVDRRPQPAAVALLADLQTLLGRADAAAVNRDLVRTLTDLQTRHGQVADLELAVYEADRGDDPARAVSLARRAHAARPDSVHAADALAWALARAGRVDDALPLVDRALRLGSADPLLRFHAAWIMSEAGRPRAARRHLEHVARSNPWFSFGHLGDAGALADDLGVDAPAAWRSTAAASR